MNELALFAGAGGGILGGLLCGFRTICAVELDPYARSILLARQDDGTLSPFPVWDDVTTFDGRPWRGIVDVVSGGFPCQDISVAGRGVGIGGSRSGLWGEMARIICEVGPQCVFVENSPALTSRGLGRVLGDLAEMGYDAKWGVLGAVHAGAPHKRERIWILANAESARLERQRPVAGKSKISESRNDGRSIPDTDRINGDSGGHGTSAVFGERREADWISGSESDVANADSGLRHGRANQPEREAQGGIVAGGCGEDVADADKIGRLRRAGTFDAQDRRGQSADSSAGMWWQSEPNVGGVAHGLAPGLDIHGAAAAGDVDRVATRIPARSARLRCIGNGQVPATASMAWRILTGTLK